MKYPSEFSNEAQAVVEEEKILANKEFNEARDAVLYPTPADLAHLIRTYIARVVLAFSKEACKLGRAKIWTVAQVR
jgi:hypothetical protein